MNTGWLFGPPTLYPTISTTMFTFFRIVVGMTSLYTLALMLPHAGRYFMSEKWGGYGESRPEVNAIQNPIMTPILLTIWVAALLLITWGKWAVWASLINLIFCWYFFVFMRWRGILRGSGAPGFMTYWMAATIFILEFTFHYMPDIFGLALLVVQVDLALIMFSAGLYKFNAGYPQNKGQQLGMVNPEWGYWVDFYRNMNPGHIVFRFINQMAWLTEIGAAVLMLFSPTRFIGATLIFLSFVFIASQIRLGALAIVVMVTSLVFFHPGSIADVAVQSINLGPFLSTAPSIALPSFFTGILRGALWAYLILLPIAHAGLFYNFYGRRRLPRVLQKGLEVYTNFFGIIIWRVFSVDVVNFFINIYQEDKTNKHRRLVSQFGWQGGILTNRFNHVSESIVLTSIFTTLKYYPSQNNRFRDRLLRYARTCPCTDGHMLVFEYVSILMNNEHFEFIPIAEYHIDPVDWAIRIVTLRSDLSAGSRADTSPIFEGTRPGSYVPSE